MQRRTLVIAAIVVVAAGWWWTHRPPNVAPADVALSVAREEWGKGFCTEPDEHWPCLIPTDIELASHLPQTVHGYMGDGQGYCFWIRYQLETTLWDPREGAPFEPRTYVAVNEPITSCAVVARAYADGDARDAGNWTMYGTQPLWWEEPLQQLESALCARSNNCALLE